MFDKKQLQNVLQRYQGLYSVTDLGYGTVRDYCDSCDHVPLLSNYQGDLKDFQRPWTVKAVLGTCQPGAKLLEIGAGEPMVAQMLAELGYQVSVIDPYDGSTGGPTDFEEFRRLYTNVNILRNVFPSGLAQRERGTFDCIYSISVLEHFDGPALAEVFEGIRVFLKPRGVSLHSFDYVSEGKDAGAHSRKAAGILNQQMSLSDGADPDAGHEFAELERKLRDDLETLYLSASGHNLWRGRTPYDQFPFRRVASIISCIRTGRGAVKRT